MAESKYTTTADSTSTDFKLHFNLSLGEVSVHVDTFDLPSSILPDLARVICDIEATSSFSKKGKGLRAADYEDYLFEREGGP